MQAIFDNLATMPELFDSGRILALVIGLSIGILIGALPGVGPLLGVVMAIPFTFYMEPVAAMGLLLGIYQGGSFGGALSATVIGIPGTPMAAATLLDAHPMALSGRASQAVTLATLASSVGGALSALVLIAVAPALAAIAIRFGPVETAAFALLGLTTMGALAGGSALKGWLMGFLGLLIATVGLDPVSGASRFSFGSVHLDSGIALIPLLVGLFGISEVMMQLRRPERAHDHAAPLSASAVAFRTLVARPVNYLRSSLVGVFVGILPGVGGVTASFLSYRLAMPFRRAADPEFGRGNPDGVIASEAANSAVTGGALIPMLALSIPGDPIVAVLMGGLMIQGVQPGAAMFSNYPGVVQGIFAMFLLGSLLLLPLGLLFLRGMVGVLRAPQWAIMCVVLLVSIVGTYAVERQILDLWLLLLFGIVGYGLRRADFPLAPIVVGFVLGPIFEKNFRRAGLISQGDLPGLIAERPIALCVLAVTALFVLAPMVGALRRIAAPRPSHSDP